MTVEAPPPPVRAAGTPPVPVKGTVAQAWRLLRSHPRQTLLPMFAVQAPVAVITAVVTLVLYFTAFRDEPVRTPSELLDAGVSGPLFAFLALSAFQALFSQVARGATIVGVAAASRGRDEPLAQLLDPAFTHMGGLLILAIIPIAMLLGLAATVVGLVIAPYLLLRLGLAVEAYMLDGVTPMRSFGQSWRRLSGSMWRFLATMLVAVAVIGLPLVLASSLGSIAAGGRDAQVVVLAVATFIQDLLVVPLLAFFTAVTAVFYLELKARQDGRFTARI